MDIQSTPVYYNTLYTLAAAGVLYTAGLWIVDAAKCFKRRCILKLLVGGLLFAAFNTFAYANGLPCIIFDDALQTTLMAAFFTTVGVQAKMGQDPRLGLAVGSIALVGDPGSVVGISAATFGLVVGSVLGSPVAQWIIQCYRIKGRWPTRPFPWWLPWPARWSLCWCFAVSMDSTRLGRHYDAAVMTSGFIGVRMGATSNAMANMQALTREHSPSPTAFLVIPVVGGMVIDSIKVVVVSFLIPLLGGLV